jgi:outer membrane lipoprotein-sorting protein
MSFLGLFVLNFYTLLALAAPTAKITSASTEQMALLKETDKRYQDAKAVTMSVDKVDKLSALDQTRVFGGTLYMKRGKFRLELESKDKNKDTSMIIADGTTLWFVTPPPKEFKDAKTQVVEGSLKDKRAKAQGLLQMLTEGGVVKYFKVNGVNDSTDNVTYYLQPNSSSVEFRRAQVAVHKKDKIIASLKYWDSMDNETTYTFSKVDFEKTVKDELLSYKPPKSADVVNY